MRSSATAQLGLGKKSKKTRLMPPAPDVDGRLAAVVPAPEIISATSRSLAEEGDFTDSVRGSCSLEDETGAEKFRRRKGDIYFCTCTYYSRTFP